MTRRTVNKDIWPWLEISYILVLDVVDASVVALFMVSSMIPLANEFCLIKEFVNV